MFQSMPVIPQPPQRGPIGVVADSVAGAIARAFARIGAPKRDAALDFLLGVLPNIPTLIQVLKPSVPVDLDGPAVQQVKRELAAQEAHLAAVTAEKRARLIADFGPKFDAAQNLDNASSAHGSVGGEEGLQ